MDPVHRGAWRRDGANALTWDVVSCCRKKSGCGKKGKFAAENWIRLLAGPPPPGAWRICRQLPYNRDGA